MARRIREEYIDEAPVTRRRVVERRAGGYGPGYGPGAGMNAIAAVVAGILVVFILVLLFGYLL